MQWVSSPIHDWSRCSSLSLSYSSSSRAIFSFDGRRRSYLEFKTNRINLSNFSSGSNAVQQKDGIIIVDHGSRLQKSNLMLNDFVSIFRERTGFSIVEPAHMELSEPSIRDSFHSCVNQGACRIIVSPFFIFPGRHWEQDIPLLVSEAAKNHPGMSYIVTAPIGLHELLVDVVKDRMLYCLRHASGNVDECKVCKGTDKCKFYS